MLSDSLGLIMVTPSGFRIFAANFAVDLSPDIPIEHGRFTDFKILSLIK